jgi:4-oxalocrotonate tautomerase
MDTIGNGKTAVSASIEDIRPSDWAEAVCRVEILGNADTFYKKPGYSLS